jgi:hypothetical protein
MAAALTAVTTAIEDKREKQLLGSCLRQGAEPYPFLTLPTLAASAFLVMTVRNHNATTTQQQTAENGNASQIDRDLNNLPRLDSKARSRCVRALCLQLCRNIN